MHVSEEYIVTRGCEAHSVLLRWRERSDEEGLIAAADLPWAKVATRHLGSARRYIYLFVFFLGCISIRSMCMYDGGIESTVGVRTYF